MNSTELSTRAARAAVFQRRHGDSRPLRRLWRDSVSLLRYLRRVQIPA